MKINMSWKKKLWENILWSVIGKQTNQAVKDLLEDRLGIVDGNNIFVSLLLVYKSRFHVVVCLFSNWWQKISNCGKNISGTFVFLPHFDVSVNNSAWQYGFYFLNFAFLLLFVSLGWVPWCNILVSTSFSNSFRHYLGYTAFERNSCYRTVSMKDNSCSVTCRIPSALWEKWSLNQSGLP